MSIGFFRALKSPAPLILAIAGIFVASSCNSSKEQKEEEEAQASILLFHADNDIAMTVKSLVDAIRVGEPIDSLEYDFTGVLTDGQGTPLYTDLKGYPGIWIVDVIDAENVSIKNTELGDLLSDDLQAYLLDCLRLDSAARIELTTADALDNDDTNVSVYDFGGGFLRFETRLSESPTGLQGALLTIVVSSSLPKGVETQTTV